MRDDRPPHPSPAATPSPQGEGSGGGIDLKKVPFAGWLEEALPELCGLDVRCIGIVALCKNGDTATNYWNAVGDDVALMSYKLLEDAFLTTMKNNKNMLRRLMEAGDEDEKEGD